MARRDKARGGRDAALGALLEAGDHLAAAEAARALRDDPAATPHEKAAAAEVLASLRPERAALTVGIAGAFAAVAILAWTMYQGTHG